MKEFDDIEVLDVNTNASSESVDSLEDIEDDDYLIDDYMDDVEIPSKKHSTSDVSIEEKVENIPLKSQDNVIVEDIQDDLLSDFSEQIGATGNDESIQSIDKSDILFEDDIPIANDETIHSTTDIELEKEMDRDEILDEAQFRTTKYNPFEPQKPDVSPIETENDSKQNQNGITFIIILFVVLIIAIFLIPKIASILG